MLAIYNVHVYAAKERAQASTDRQLDLIAASGHALNIEGTEADVLNEHTMQPC